MIRTLSQLEGYTSRLAADHQAAAAECLLQGPGLDGTDLEALLRSLPDLPQSYLQCATRYRLESVQLAGFSLHPTGARSQFVQGLLRANSPANPQWQELQKLGLFQIGLSENERVVVAGKQATLPEGTVLMFNLFSPEEPPALLAPDFEHFLLFAGNLLEIAETLDGRKALQAFEKALMELGASEQMIDGWWEAAEEQLLG